MESFSFEGLFYGYNVILLVVAVIAPGILYAFHYATKSVKQERLSQSGRLGRKKEMSSLSF